jgi:hypothetical protein
MKPPRKREIATQNRKNRPSATSPPPRAQLNWRREVQPSPPTGIQDHTS